MKTNTIAALAGLALTIGTLTACSESPSAPVAQSQPSESTAPSVSQEPQDTIDTAAYLAAARKGADDDVPDARLLQLGRDTCAHARTNGWKAHGPIDDESRVGDLSTQLRVNIGAAAAAHLCPDQLSAYAEHLGGALGEN